MEPNPPQQTTNETPKMAISKPKAKPSGAANGVHSDYGSGAPKDQFAVDSKLGEAVRGNWKWLIGILMAGGFIVLPASRTQLDELSHKVDANQAIVIEEFKSVNAQIKGLSDRISDQNERLQRIEDRLNKAEASPVQDDRPKILPAPKKRVYRKRSGIEGLLH